MPETPLTDAIVALTTYANETSGADDRTLSDAVATLVAGYGQGGGYTIDDIAGGAPTGAITITAAIIVKNAFSDKTGITSVSAPNCTNIYNNAFYGCSGITSISFPELTTVGTYVFQGCSGLTAVAFPKLTSHGTTRMLASCTNLVTADMGTATGIDSQFLYQSTKIRTLILRKSDSVVTLNNWAVADLGGIYSNPTSSTIYVPNALLSAYQSAAKWSSAYSAGVTFTKIEGSIYETQYADGTPIQ